ncbi:MAG TPA: polysaccharide deacetylase [Ruminococcaceae bacterium]|nr:polysaccharide deacetylase [Oscillospiraceae bacterium]
MIKLFNRRIVSLFLSIFCFVLFFSLCLSVFYQSSLSAELDAAQKDVKSLNGQISGLNDDKSEAENLLREKDRKLKEADGMINRQTTELESLKKELDKLKSQNEDGENEVSLPFGNTKIAYLTFDDGPSKNTPAILSVLENYNASATFFVINSQCNEYMERIAAAGHTLAMHSYSHKYEEIYESEEKYFEDLDMIHNLILELTGVDTNILRLPGGSSNMLSKEYCTGIMTKITESLTKRGYIYFDWNVDSADASSLDVSPGKIFDSVKKGVEGKDEVHILMHDTNSKTSTLQALPLILDYLVSQGYEFRAITPNTQPVHHTVHN